jgi:hypothetical protein
MKDYPLECICWHRTEQSQLGFARKAIRILPLRPDRSLEVSNRGLVVSGETEAMVTSAIDVLKTVYREELCVGALTVRYRHGTVLEEPHMGVRVLCSASHFNAVREDLLSRGAVISDAEVMPPIGVIRATTSLVKLLGYSRHLAALTDGKAREVIWLSHYAPRAKAPAGDAVASA